MLYIDAIENIQVLYVPRNGWAPATDAEVTMKLENTSDHTRVSLTVASFAVAGHFLRLVVGLPDEGLHPGEWEWTLSWDTVAACGLAMVTEVPGEAREYNREIKIKQYGQ